MLYWSVVFLSLFFFLLIRRPPRSTRTDTLFPYTTLFRSDHETDLEAQARFEADFTRAIDDAPNLSAAGGQRLWRGHPAIKMVATVPADDRERDGPMVNRDAGIQFRSEERREGKECVS